MAIENILLKATGRVSFCSPPLLPSLYERLSPKPRQVELSKVDGLDRTVLPPKFLSTWNLWLWPHLEITSFADVIKWKRGPTGLGWALNLIWPWPHKNREIWTQAQTEAAIWRCRVWGGASTSKECQRWPATARSEEKCVGQLRPDSPQKEPSLPTTPPSQTACLRIWETMSFCCLSPPRVWQFLMAALTNLTDDRVAGQKRPRVQNWREEGQSPQEAVRVGAGGPQQLAWGQGSRGAEWAPVQEGTSPVRAGDSGVRWGGCQWGHDPRYREATKDTK